MNRYRKAVDVISALLIILFFYAGGTKLLERHTFEVQLAFCPSCGEVDKKRVQSPSRV